MNFRPLGARVLVERDAIEEKVLPSGLVVPEVAQERPQQATVVALGEVAPAHEYYREMVSLKPGSRIMLGKYSGADIRVDGKLLTIVPAADILGVMG